MRALEELLIAEKRKNLPQEEQHKAADQVETEVLQMIRGNETYQPLPSNTTPASVVGNIIDIHPSTPLSTMQYPLEYSEDVPPSAGVVAENDVSSPSFRQVCH